MFWERNVRPLYEFLGGYIRERQREGAMIELEPRVVVRAFVGMVIHHSLNNNLWDQKRSLLSISNKEAARQFTEILLNGVLIRNPAKQSNGRRDGKRLADGRTSASRSKR
jgi:hypothetical protein